MTASRRGFGNERYTKTKLAVAGLSLAGFVAAWAALGASHDAAGSIDVADRSSTTTTAPSRSPVAGAGTAAGPAVRTPATPPATVQKGVPATQTPVARRSRGS